MITDLLGPVRRALFIGAHPDDIEIGCGVTVRRLVAAGADVRWLVLTGDAVRAAEAATSAERLLGDASRLTQHGYRDGYLPYDRPGEVKEAVVAHRDGFDPDIVVAPSRDDAHQDHRFLAEVALQVYRRQLLLGYEIPKYDGDMAAVNLYVPVTAEEAARKVDDLHDCYPSQRSKPWFDAGLFMGLMRLRGVEAAAAEGLAEGFVARKLVVE